MLRGGTDLLPNARREGVGKLIDCGTEIRATSALYMLGD